MNRREALSFLKTYFAGLKSLKPGAGISAAALKPFLDLAASLKRDLPLSIPLLREFAGLGAGGGIACGNPLAAGGRLLGERINRRYLRLCRIQEELGALDFRKAAPGVSPEDYVFSRIDFSRYREMDAERFDRFFLRGFADFGPGFFRKNFGLAGEEARALIEGSYKESGGRRKIGRENPLVLSLMRSLETSLETSPLVGAGEIENEMAGFLDFLEGAGEAPGGRFFGNRGSPGKTGSRAISGMEKLFPHLVFSLSGKTAAHEDGTETKLFISPRGDLSGVFRPLNKPWTLVLIPAEAAEMPAAGTPSAETRAGL